MKDKKILPASQQASFSWRAIAISFSRSFNDFVTASIWKDEKRASSHQSLYVNKPSLNDGGYKTNKVTTFL